MKLKPIKFRNFTCDFRRRLLKKSPTRTAREGSQGKPEASDFVVETNTQNNNSCEVGRCLLL